MTLVVAMVLWLRAIPVLHDRRKLTGMPWYLLGMAVLPISVMLRFTSSLCSLSYTLRQEEESGNMEILICLSGVGRGEGKDVGEGSYVVKKGERKERRARRKGSWYKRGEGGIGKSAGKECERRGEEED